MTKKLSITLVLLLFSIVSISAQTPTSPAKDEDDVVKITTKLVQIDAVVTDKNGNQVTNLTADDFEIFQDGKPQKINGFSYIGTAAPGSNVAGSSGKAEKNTAPLPPARNRAADYGRVITFIVDDGNCTASQVGMVAVREALEKFINEQMAAGDVVAIYQTRGGSSLLQQYTADKAQLLRVARKIRWLPVPGCGSSGDFFEAARSNRSIKLTPEGSKSVQIESEDDRRRREASEDSIRDNQTVGSLGVMNYVIRGLERIGGRKVVFLLSDGMPILTRNGDSRLAFDALRDLTDMANRASVVFNTIDVRGLFDASLIEARDEVYGEETPDVLKPSGTEKVVAERTKEFRRSQDGLSFLAQETGGRFFQGQNALDVPIRRALSVEKGYYLLAYVPEEDETFKGKNFNRIEIRVKRPELRVLSRAGFLGRTDDAAKPKKRSGDSELYEAIVAPLPRAGLNMRLTAFYGNSPTEGSYIRSLIHLDGREITFTDEPNGFKKAVFDVVAVTLNEKNQVIDEFNRTHTFKVEAAAVPLIQQNGLVYSTDVPAKKNGVYNFRVALRDASSGMLGSAAQIIQVPDIKKNNLYLSGLSLSQTDASGKFLAPSAVKPENAISMLTTTAVPAIRQFKRGMVLAYSYTLYNAVLDKSANKPKLTVQVSLYRDGKLITEGPPQPAELQPHSDWTRINDFNYLRLNQTLQNGDYALQVTVKDLSNNQSASQWIDFEVVE